jgi:NADPH:quinone reductase-like Zn-dependent oxidoreductase
VELSEIDRPIPTDDHVLVRVQAASINRADLDLLRPEPGFARLFLGLRRPKDRQVGCDVAGVVEAIGPNVTRYQPGDAVFGDMYNHGLGGFAEYKCAPENAFLAIPAGMAIEDAATLPHAAILAIQGLRWRDGPTVGPGSRVLIDGASGNVGPFAVQIAKSMGCDVTGVCSADKAEFVRSLGADHVIDYAKVDYTNAGQRYDWIIDVQGHHPILRARRALQPNGVYITLGGSTGRILQSMVLGPLISKASHKRMGLMLWWKPFKADDVATLADLMSTGKLVPAIDRRFPLAEVVDALRYVDEGHPKGKVLITMNAAPMSSS